MSLKLHNSVKLSVKTMVKTNVSFLLVAKFGLTCQHAISWKRRKGRIWIKYHTLIQAANLSL